MRNLLHLAPPRISWHEALEIGAAEAKRRSWRWNEFGLDQGLRSYVLFMKSPTGSGTLELRIGMRDGAIKQAAIKSR
jgi:hypothetical protein